MVLEWIEDRKIDKIDGAVVLGKVRTWMKASEGQMARRLRMDEGILGWMKGLGQIKEPRQGWGSTRIDRGRDMAG